MTVWLRQGGIKSRKFWSTLDTESDISLLSTCALEIAWWRDLWFMIKFNFRWKKIKFEVAKDKEPHDNICWD